MKRLNFYLNVVLVFTFVFIANVMAQVVELPTKINETGDPMQSLIFAIQNFKGLGPVGLGMVVVMAVVQAMKSEKFGALFKSIAPKYQAALITLLGIIYGAVYSLVYTKQSVDVFIVGFISSGGAVAVFNLIKLLTEKKTA